MSLILKKLQKYFLFDMKLISYHLHKMVSNSLNYSLNYSLFLFIFLAFTSAQGCHKEPEYNCDDLIISNNPPLTNSQLGKVSIPNSNNWATGMKITDCNCWVKAIKTSNNTLSVQSNFWEGKKVSKINDIAGKGFSLGTIDHNYLFVLQNHINTPVSLTITSYDQSGVLNYGASGSGKYIKECLIL